MKEKSVLLLDIGGTNSRIYLYEKLSFVKEIANFQPKNLSDFNIRFKKAIENLDKNIPAYGCFAGKFLKEEKIISVTKWGKPFKVEDIFGFLGNKNVFILNDAEAAICGLNEIRKNLKCDFILGKKIVDEKKPFCLLYLGTGLGVSAFFNEPVSSEIGSLTMPLSDRENKQLKIKGDVLVEDLVSGRGLSKLAKSLYGIELTPEEISRKILEGKMKRVGMLFAKYLARATKMCAIAFGVDIVYIGGKPTEPFLQKFYDEFKREFLSDKINSWWLKRVAVAKIDFGYDLTLEGLKVLAKKIEMGNKK